MNFYKHHLGDYAQATAHLSFVEDAAYSRCIRKYYADERALPADVPTIQRLIGARTREERAATQRVLEEFFDLELDGWHNKRCDEELGKANAQAEANRRTAIDREARRRARTDHESSDDSLHEQSTNRDGGPSTNRSRQSSATAEVREPSQTPDSRLQTPEREEGRAESIPPGVARAPEDAEPERQPTRAGAACLAMRRAGLTSVNPGDPRLIALLEQGATDAELAAMAGEAAGKGKGWAWVLAAVQGRRAEAAAISLAPPPAQTAPSSDAERTAKYLRDQEMTPEQRERADAARAEFVAKHRGARAA